MAIKNAFTSRPGDSPLKNGKDGKKKEKPKKEKLTTVMDKELLQKVKVISAKTGMKVCDIIDECVRNALDERLFEDRY
ncbi:MAG: ribbon-helix-helix domain-containing protein [Aeriscardovia sp.]|nr:ribbon-helix-helix domain-containing protein [Aeriscardovia sp.]